MHRTTKHYLYELMYHGEGSEGNRFVVGLIDPESLSYDAHRSGLNKDRSASGRGAVGAQSGGGRVDDSDAKASNSNGLGASSLVAVKNAPLSEKSLTESYAH